MASSVSGNTTPFWIKFFTDAGIPAGEAANYAVTFTDHRIQMDMLLELNKEYLNDMGISLMGDVIAILRHAKTVHTQNTREKALKGTAAAASTRCATPPAQRKTPASRMVDHYLQLSGDPDAGPMNSSPVRTPAMQARLGDSSGGHQSPSGRQSPANIVRISTIHQREEVPVPKVRRVLPEHEGRYKIIMPSGTTKKTRKILEAQGLAPKKNTVFDRLGQSAGPAAASSKSGPQITVTGLGKIKVQASTASEEGTSVFTRLGGKKTAVKRAATSTSNIGDSDSDGDSGMPLEYAGVLKDSPVKRRAKEAKKKAVETQRRMMAEAAAKRKAEANSVQAHTAGILAQDTMEQKVPLRHRLGPKVTDVSSTTLAASGITSAKRIKIAKLPGRAAAKGVLSRLGPQLEVSSTEELKAADKGVFERLGKKLTV